MERAIHGPIGCRHDWSSSLLGHAFVVVMVVVGLAQGGCGGRGGPAPVHPVVWRDADAEDVLKTAGLNAACFRIEGGSAEMWPDGDKSFDWCRQMSRMSLSSRPWEGDAAAGETTHKGTVILIHEPDGAWKFQFNEKVAWKTAPAKPKPKRIELSEGEDVGEALSEALSAALPATISAALTATSQSRSSTSSYRFTLPPAEGQLPGYDGQRLVVNLEKSTDLDGVGVVLATIESLGEGNKVLRTLPIRCALALKCQSARITGQ